MAGFAAELRAEHDTIWRSIHQHPFVEGIRTGELSPERFAYYLRQDYVYLVAYCRVIALACAKADDVETMIRLADLLSATLSVEMELHRRYSGRFGVAPDALVAEAPTPTTHAYTSHLLATAYSGSLLDVLGSLLPCQVGYYELGTRLSRDATPLGHERYGEWIDAYSSPAYGDIVAWLTSRFDGIAEHASDREHERVRALYGRSCRYEYAFWQMALIGESWPPASR